MKIAKCTDNKSGQTEGKFGTFTWYACGVQFAEHGEKWFNGFIKDYELKKLGVRYPSELNGKDVEVEIFQEEYNGQTQDKFKLVLPKGGGGAVTEMAIKTHIDQKFDALERKLFDTLADIGEKLGMEQKTDTIGEPKEPEVPEITDEDIPF